MDILFNAAQTMTDLAEEIIENATSEEQVIQESPIVLLREALELLDTCFQRQQALFEEQQQQPSSSADAPTEDDAGVPLDTGDRPPVASQNDEPGESETFATIQHPVTPADLLDTANASLAALILLVSVDEPSSLSTLANLGDNLTSKTIPQCISRLPDDEQPAAKTEAALEAASFVAALSNTEFMAQIIDMPTYISRMAAFEALDLAGDFATVCTYADHLVELTKAVIQASSPKFYIQHAQDAWDAASKAQSLYETTLGFRNSPDLTSDRKASILESRADVSLLCCRLCLPAFELPPIMHDTLPAHCEAAQRFYQSANREYRASGDERAATKVEIRYLASRLCTCTYKIAPSQLRDTLLASLQNHSTLGELVLREMLEEGLFEENVLHM